MIGKRIILMCLILFVMQISVAYDHTILLLSPSNELTGLSSSSVNLSWQTLGSFSSTNNLKYVVKVMTIDESEQIPTSLDFNCSSCGDDIGNIITFQSELGSYTFNASDCNKYVWQITLIEDIPASQDPDGDPIPASQQIIGQSVVNSFTTLCNLNQRLGSVTHQYLTFPAEYTSYVYGMPNNSSSIYFKYESEYNNQIISYKIFDELHILIESQNIGFPFSKGVNYEEIILPSGIASGKTYFLEVYNEKDAKKTLKFRKENP